MKKLLSATLFLSIFTTVNLAQAYDLPATGMSAENIEALIRSGTLTEAQENQLIDYLESSDEEPTGPIGELDTQAIEAYRAYKNDRDLKEPWNDIAGEVGTLRKLQDDSVEQIIGKGQWAFDFVFVDKKGKRTQLAAYNIHEAVKPASTLKIFTAWAAFRRGTYPLGTMGHMLKWSSNIEADAALKSVADKERSFVVPKNHYVNSLVGYYMTMKGRKYTIDAKIAKGCAILQKDYVGLVDGNKFHPVNGSGLQQSSKDKLIHENKVTARLQTGLLYSILNSGKYNTFKNLLARPGGDGTLRRNFRTLSKTAKIYAKTGTLGNSKSLAGFVELENGTLLFSVIGNDLKGVGSPSEALAGEIENVIYLNSVHAANKIK
jgi:hypothetical protein